ncbi:MAG: GNAT family N-acetyltransferase [Armatimonadetes bacterium]|nr:GNAT family N-acetyltransferase [Armatimonadota bacterium]
MEQIRLYRTPEYQDCMKIHLGISETKIDISRLWAPTYRMRIGSAEVKMGGIAGVGTDDDCRLRGYSRLVMEESTRYFNETGHDIAVLFGIPDFYHRFGYAPALVSSAMVVSVKDALLSLAGTRIPAHTLRPMVEEDRAGILDIYHADTAHRSGCLVRSPEEWKGFSKGTSYECGSRPLVLEGDSDGLLGYIVFDEVENECRIGEVGGRSPAIYPALLKAMAEQAQQKGAPSFILRLPLDHPFIFFCRRCGGESSSYWHRNAEGMARLINLESLMTKLTGLFTHRLRGFPLPIAPLAFRTDLGTVTLTFRDGQAGVGPQASSSLTVSIPQMRLAQWVMGYRAVADVILDEGVDAPEEAVPLLKALFPPGTPWMPMTDWF